MEKWYSDIKPGHKTHQLSPLFTHSLIRALTHTRYFANPALSSDKNTVSEVSAPFLSHSKQIP
jgi:hypothetical protein